MKTSISVITFCSFLSISDCYSDATKDTDSGTAEQGAAAPRPAANRY